MSLWQPRSLVAFALAAGWHGDQVTGAVAACLAVSQGDDARLGWRAWHTDPQPLGLWGIPVTEQTPEAHYRALLHPQTNADTAWKMWAQREQFWWLPPTPEHIMSAALQLARQAVAAGPGSTLLAGSSPAAPPRSAPRPATGRGADPLGGFAAHAQSVRAGRRG